LFVLFVETFKILVIQAVAARNGYHWPRCYDRLHTILSNAVISSFNVLILHFLSYYECYVILI